MKSTPVTTMAAPARSAQSTVFSILFSISFAHLVNDMLQSVIPSVYPIFKEKYGLTFTQIGLITLVYQLTASLLQPLVGVYTDRKARPYSLPIGMAFTLTGLIALAFAKGFYNILFSVSFIGIGSSIFHPESSRVAHLASGGKKGWRNPFSSWVGTQAAPLAPCWRHCW
ncbi:MFS transporter [Chitinophaga sedimenti]|uniref:MFS transporter n=1 Tax=Chitinophaga sedimenti TaxID=2033606 RepID=UPI00249E2F3D|nr:MFS transporter [Chitinophaga sedimenti]